MNTRYVYLDHNATTPLHPQVKNSLIEELESHFGNPSSIHWAGRKSKNIIRNARQNLAELLSVSPLELIFTSGASESSNTVIQVVHSLNLDRNEYICSEVEHPSVLKTMQYLQSLGAVVHKIPVNRNGELDLEFYRKVLSEKTALVSVMLANNETGNIFPVKELARLAHEKGALFHTDAVQGLGKIEINLKDLDVDYASFSAHKFYALKGCGLLYAKKGTPQVPFIWGGAQERSRRGGTENVLGILSLGVMAKMKDEISFQFQRLEKLRNEMQSEIFKKIPDCQVTGSHLNRLPNTLSLVIDGIDGETLLMNLDIKGFAVSTGAACSSGNPEPSPVLLAMGLTRGEAQSSLRISLGWQNTKEEVDRFIVELEKSVLRLRNLDQVSHPLEQGI